MSRTDLRQALAHGLSALSLPEPVGHVLVALSGGPDSSALLIAAVEAGYDVTAAHFDHALHPASTAAAGYAEALCRRLGVRLTLERRSEALPGGSVQAGAREARYAFLARASAAGGAPIVLLAHTADDLVEGAVLHLLRGCALAGLRGMPAVRLPYVRPWLGVWRSEITSFLEARAVRAFQDPANSDLKHARAWVRHELLPRLEDGRPGIVRRLHAVARSAARLQAVAADAASALLARGDPTDAELLSLPGLVAGEVLRQMYAAAGGRDPALNRSQLEAMLGAAEASRAGRGGLGVDLPGRIRFRVSGHRVAFVASQPAVQHSLEVRPCRGCADPHAVHLRQDLRLALRARTPGLRMRPIGRRGSRKLQDIMVDAHLPREDRDRWPLVFAGDALAWVPGLAVDAAMSAAPGQESQHVNVHPWPAWPAKLVV